MKKLACIFFEGSDSKLVTFSKEKNGYKLLKASSIESSQAFTLKKSSPSAGPNTELMYFDQISEEMLAYNNSYLQKIRDFFAGEDLNDYEFIPILTEPGLHFQKIKSDKDLSSLSLSPKDKSKNKTLDFISLSDNSKVAVYPSGQINYLQAMDSLAKLSGKRFLKISKVKCAEASLANYISKIKQLNPEHISLIIYFGKEYTKLLFMKGNKLLHIGSTLSVGSHSARINHVVVSKILFEREHASLNPPNNVFICGEKINDEFTTLLSSSYPKAKISYFPDKGSDTKIHNAKSPEWSSYSVPFAVADEYLNEIQKKYKGIDLLPPYIREQQKNLQLAWHGVALLVALFAAVLFSTFFIFLNEFKIKNMDAEIKSLIRLKKQNQEIVDRIANLNSKIDNSEQVRLFLDQISSGSGVWVHNMEKLSDFTNKRRNLWIQNIKIDKANPMIISGFSTSRWVLPELKRSYNYSTLDFIHYEPMRDRNAYEFNLKMVSSNRGQQ
jgi:hypothetical protein